MVGNLRRSQGHTGQGSESESHRSSTSPTRLSCLGLQTEPSSTGQEEEPGMGCGGYTYITSGHAHPQNDHATLWILS